MEQVQLGGVSGGSGFPKLPRYSQRQVGRGGIPGLDPLGELSSGEESFLEHSIHRHIKPVALRRNSRCSGGKWSWVGYFLLSLP